MTPKDRTLLGETPPDPGGESGSAVADLVDAVVEGAVVDWQSVESAARPGDLAVIRALREVETVVTAHRKVIAEETPERRRPQPLHAGDSWSYLEIRGYLGGGGFGDVYEAWDPRIERPTALKILQALEAPDDALLKEARLLAKVSHPNVVKVYGADRLDGRVGISMELLEGHTLTDELDQFGPMSADDAVVIGMKLCDALAEVHRQGIVHRDVKAQNVMRAQGGRIVLMDFGIGLDDSADAAARPAGTPAYQAPELLTGGAPGVATDVYALGVLLFHLVTADFPVRGRSMKEFRERHEAGEVKHLRDVRPGLPEAFVRVVEKALEADPGRRFRSAGALQRALSRAMESSFLGGTPKGRPIGWRRLLRNTAVYGSVWTVIFGLLWFLFWPRDSDRQAKVLLAPLLDRSGEPAFGASADASVRSALRSSSLFAPVPSVEEARVSREMLREDPKQPFSDEEVEEAALRTGSAGIVDGEILSVGDGWQLRLWLEPMAEDGFRATAEHPMSSATNAELDAAVDAAVADLERQARAWLDADGPLGRQPEPLAEATTSSLEALRHYTAAVQAYSDGDIESSETNVRLALQQDPEFALAQLQLGHSAAAQGNPEAALQAVLRAHELRERTSTDLERLTIEGAYFAVVRRYTAALGVYRQVLDLRGEDPTTLRQMAIAYQALGDLGMAIDAARSARYAEGSESINHGYLVYTLATAGKAEEALIEAAGARERFGPSFYLMLSEALAHLILDDPESALRTTQELAATDGRVYPNLASWMEARIQIYDGNLDRAAEILYRDRRTDAVESTEFLSMRRRYWTARLYWLEGRADDALQVLRNVELQMIPAHMTGWRSLAVLQAELGDTEGARQVLVRLEALRDEYPSLLADLVTSEVRGAVAIAEDAASEAVRVLSGSEAQSDVSFVRTLARAYVALGEFERAVEYDDLLVARRGELIEGEFAGLWVESLVRRARCLEKLGRTGDAEASWAQAHARWGDLADRAYGPGGPADVVPDRSQNSR